MVKIKGWETKIMRILFRFKRISEETSIVHGTRTARTARTIWKKLNVPSLSEIIAESMWRNMGGTRDQRQNVCASDEITISSMSQPFLTQ